MKYLEGVEVKLSEVNKTINNGRIEIYHCRCLKPNGFLWMDETLNKDEIFQKDDNHNNTICNKCGYHPWMIKKQQQQNITGGGVNDYGINEQSIIL
jgi:hypothetical protein